MTDRSGVAAVAWAETSALSPIEGGDAAVRRLLEDASFLILKAGAAGFAKPVRLPAADEAGIDMAKWLLGPGLDAAERGTSSADGGALPNKVAILPVDGVSGRSPAGAVPAGAGWVTAAGVQPVALFRRSPLGGVYGLFQSGDPLGAADFPFVSLASGTGVPIPPPNTRVILPWTLGLLAVVLFLWTAMATLTLGRTMGHAVDLMAGRSPDYTLAYLDTVKLPNCPDNVKDGVCTGMDMLIKDRDSRDAQDAELRRIAIRLAARPAAAQKATLEVEGAVAAAIRFAAARDLRGHAAQYVQKCETAMAAYARSGTAVPPVSGADGALVDYCSQAWRGALDYSRLHIVNQFVGAEYVGPLAKAAAANGSASLTLPTMLIMLSVVALAAAVGWGTVGVPLGPLINRQNRISLALTQVTAWTVVVLGAFVSYAMFNAGALSGVANGLPPAGKQGAEFIVYPTIPYILLCALGITFGSTMLSALIKGQRNTVGDQTIGVQPTAPTDAGAKDLIARASPSDASLADLFLGETVDSQARLDMSRLQMVVITAALLITYGHLVFAQAAFVSLFDAMGVFQTGALATAALPNVTESFISLLLISHASYLIPKAADAWLKPKP